MCVFIFSIYVVPFLDSLLERGTLLYGDQLEINELEDIQRSSENQNIQ